MSPRMHCAAILTAAALASVGCTIRHVPEGPSPGIRVPGVGGRQDIVVVLDKSLQNWDKTEFSPTCWSLLPFGRKERDRYAKLAVESTRAGRTATGTVEVVAVLRNRTDHALQVEGRTQFLDDNNIPVEKPSAWQRVFISPQSSEAYRESSVSVQEVKHFLIEVREGR